ncbi:uncharacterized protein N7473_001187 [Penicillium subrubescens]|uniref:C2H2-type domain-containing protein n=1 Tax=Penicillium subrubescens TaxID=1316194 RepID=A0A1Q5UR41_9EURO|nr:uncharacterized protein N7473_001187 [Penicillium subrubescens]KAJ5911884.1 hypothetical protein N7473_001187 [Penicillium subrubescens]OKP14948.1 hypothetical protein PENSUB_4698 [Penicillium subrubescens]
MHAKYSPTSALLDFDREVHAPSMVSAEGLLFNSENFSPLPDMSAMRPAHWRAKDMNAPVPDSAACGPLGLTETPAGVQPPLGYASAPQDVTSFLAPATYLSDRDSPVSDAIGSLHAWSSASGAEMMRPLSTSSIDPAIASTTASPFMQPYYTYGSSQPSMHPPIQSVSGYTPQQINKWCMESDLTGGLYQTTPPYPAISPLAFPSSELPQPCYSTFGENMTTPEQQWLSPPPMSFSRGPSSTSSNTAHTHDSSFLSPSSDSCSAMSTSPAPTVLSDFESSSSRHPSSPPFNPADLSRYGIPAGEGIWRCAHPGCTSQAIFRRGCDLRKHFNRHRKHLFCRHEGCPQSKQGGFSSKKDRARHEAKHNPGIVCEWDGCGRVFSRVDNMKDHVRRIHRRGGSR